RLQGRDDGGPVAGVAHTGRDGGAAPPQVVGQPLELVAVAAEESEAAPLSTDGPAQGGADAAGRPRHDDNFFSQGAHQSFPKTDRKMADRKMNPVPRLQYTTPGTLAAPRAMSQS